MRRGAGPDATAGDGATSTRGSASSVSMHTHTLSLCITLESPLVNFEMLVWFCVRMWGNERCADGDAERASLSQDIAQQCMEKLWQRQVAACACECVFAFADVPNMFTGRQLDGFYCGETATEPHLHGYLFVHISDCLDRTHLARTLIVTRTFAQAAKASMSLAFKILSLR